MTAPDRIYINKVYGQHPEDWDFTDGKHLGKRQLAEKVEYVRADLARPTPLAEAAEAKVAALVTAAKAVADDVCSYICPSIGLAGAEIPHDPACIALRAAISGCDHG